GAAFHRDLRVEMARDALIVDTLNNNGGHTSQLIIENLSRRVIGWDTGRHNPLTSYPDSAPRGPLVSIANEWAGSDGDIVNAAFKALDLGPVIGTRTWGGVIGIDGRYTLVDGTSVTQPRYSFWFEQFGWAVENHGVDPDVVVEFPPQAWGAGDEPQLTAAIERIQAELASRAAKPAARGPFDDLPITVVDTDNLPSFSELGLPKALAQALSRAGIQTPFPIQAATIPDALTGRDVLGRASTGAGKTLAFGLP